MRRNTPITLHNASVLSQTNADAVRAERAISSPKLSPHTHFVGTRVLSTEAQRRPWLQDTCLWVLLVGPLVAPLFVALGLPVLRPFADGIYLMGEAVCPKPDAHLTFLGQPVAVCSSCWAAVFGLWAIRLLHGRAGEGAGPFSRLRLGFLWRAWNQATELARFGLLALSFVPWFIDVALWDLGIWASPQSYMMFAGFLGGLGAGALLLPAAASARYRRAMRVRARLAGAQVG